MHIVIMQNDLNECMLFTTISVNEIYIIDNSIKPKNDLIIPKLSNSNKKS